MENNFNRDLKDGQAAEAEFRQILLNEGWQVHTPEPGLFPDYDLLAIKGDETIKYEVKTDRQALQTKNVATEIGKVLKDGRHPSGLTATKADYYVVKIQGDEYFYVVAVKAFRKLIAEGKYPTLMAGDGGRVVTALVPIADFLSIVERKVPRLVNDNKHILDYLNRFIKQLQEKK